MRGVVVVRLDLGCSPWPTSALRRRWPNVPTLGVKLLPFAPGALQVLVAVAFDGLDDAVPAHRLCLLELLPFSITGRARSAVVPLEPCAKVWR